MMAISAPGIWMMMPGKIHTIHWPTGAFAVQAEKFQMIQGIYLPTKGMEVANENDE